MSASFPRTVFENHGLRCPQCHRDDGLVVDVAGTVLLTPDGSLDDGAHEWNDESRCVCTACHRYEARVRNFRPDPKPFPAHPLPIGFRIISVKGEQDEDDDQERFTGPEAIGVIDSVDRYKGQGWTYGVLFQDSGVYVFLDEGDPLHDPAHYRPATPVS